MENSLASARAQSPAADPRPVLEHAVKASTLVRIALVSAGLLLFEVAITRAFSVALQYHFVFLAVSSALAGLAAGAVFTCLAKGSLAGRLRTAAGFALPVTVMATTAILGLQSLGPTWPVYGLLAGLPFVAGGAWLAAVFSARPSAAGRLYALDLAGAAFGAAVSVPLLDRVDPLTAMLIAGSLTGLAALLPSHFGSAPRRMIAMAAGLALVLVPVVQLAFSPLGLPLDPSLESPKTMLQALGDPTAGARRVETRWSSQAQTDRVTFADTPAQAIFTDAGAGTDLIPFDGDFLKLEWLRRTTAFVPFATGSPDDTLVIGAGAGKDVVLALMGGAKRVTAVELNAATVAMVREQGELDGHIYDRSDVSVVVDEGRSFVRRTSERFDVVDLSLVVTQTSDALGYSLAENYIYTVEAFEDYLGVLKPGGTLGLVLHGDTDLTRAITTAMAALSARGVADGELADHLAIVGSFDASMGGTLMYPVLLVKNEPFTLADSNALRSAIDSLSLSAVHIPRVLPSPRIEQIAGSPDARRTFIASLPFDASPVTDAQPFFYKVYPGLSDELRTAAQWLLSLLLIFIVAPSGRDRRRLVPSPRQVRSRVYVAFAGIAFMLVEVGLLQRLILLLGWPSLALAVGLPALLLAGALGSALSQRWPADALRRRGRVAAGGLGLVVLAYIWIVPLAISASIAAPLPIRIGVAALLLFAPGVLMGTQFPTAMRAFGNDGREVAWAWAVNGVGSVLGSVLAIGVAQIAGFGATIVAAAAAYAVMAVLAPPASAGESVEPAVAVGAAIDGVATRAELGA